MASLTLSNDRIRMVFGANPLSVASLKNLGTGLQFSRGGSQSFLVRMPNAISDPVFLSVVESQASSAHGVSFTLRDESGGFRADVSVTSTPEGLAYLLKLTAPEPVWVVEWRLEELDLDEVVLPALGGQSLTKQMPPDVTLTYKYPFWLNAQFVLGLTAGGGVWLKSKDEKPVFKFMRVRRTGKTFMLSYGVEANGPLNANTIEATWYLDCFRGSWKIPTDEYRSWLEATFRPAPLRSNPHLPKWAQDVDFILEMWGIGKDSPRPFHTFDQMNERLRQWRKIHDPARTLVYLPGFAGHGIDSQAPDYTPSPQLGGKEKFRNLVDSAHRLGYRVMVHTNAIAMTFNHRLYREFERYQVVDVFGRRQGWGLDIDGDWLTEPYFAYMNPGTEEWRDLMVSVIGDLIVAYGVDAVFLDQTLLAFNVGSGPNFVTGMREYIRRLRQEFPNTLFAGEGLHEQVVEVLPMVQIHGIDSITEVHGIEGRTRWRKAHPISTYLFGRYSRFMAHLLTRHPSHPLFALQESSYARLGVIPALCLYHHRQPLDTPAVRRMIRRAGRT